MRDTDQNEITRILNAWNDGDANAADRLIPYVYDELKRQARILMARERPDHTLQPTALVHEAFLRLAEMSGINWHDRGHFFSITSRLMRRILVDHARYHATAKRGRRPVHFSVDSLDIPVSERAESILILDETLDRLAKLDPKQAQVVEMRFFGGFNNVEIAQSIGISERTVAREWRSARLWLIREFQAGF